MSLGTLRERLERRRSRRRNAHRFRQIAGVAVRYGLADRRRKIPGSRMQQWLRGSAGESIVDLGTPVRIRLALSELGTTFVKFGQMLSTRPDLVGQDAPRLCARDRLKLAGHDSFCHARSLGTGRMRAP